MSNVSIPLGRARDDATPAFHYSNSQYSLSDSLKFSVTNFNLDMTSNLQNFICTGGLLPQLAFIEYASLCIFSTFTFISVDLIGNGTGEFFSNSVAYQDIVLSIDMLDTMPSVDEVTEALSLLLPWVSVSFMNNYYYKIYVTITGFHPDFCLAWRGEFTSLGGGGGGGGFSCIPLLR